MPFTISFQPTLEPHRQVGIEPAACGHGQNTKGWTKHRGPGGKKGCEPTSMDFEFDSSLVYIYIYKVTIIYHKNAMFGKMLASSGHNFQGRHNVRYSTLILAWGPIHFLMLIRSKMPRIFLRVIRLLAAPQQHKKKMGPGGKKKAWPRSSSRKPTKNERRDQIWYITYQINISNASSQQSIHLVLADSGNEQSADRLASKSTTSWLTRCKLSLLSRSFKQASQTTMCVASSGKKQRAASQPLPSE